MLCYLQDPLSTSASRPGLLNQRPGMGHRPQWAHSQWLQAGFDSGLHCLQLFQLEAAAVSGVLSLTANWFSLWPSLPLTASTAMGICIYYFITPTYFRLDHMIFDWRLGQESICNAIGLLQLSVSQVICCWHEIRDIILNFSMQKKLHLLTFINVCWMLIIFTQSLCPSGYDTRSIFKWSLTGLNSEFSFS